eukprot:Nk52_evm13s212 gene=Nk52_evmTU13s212
MSASFLANTSRTVCLALVILAVVLSNTATITSVSAFSSKDIGNVEKRLLRDIMYHNHLSYYTKHENQTAAVLNNTCPACGKGPAKSFKDVQIFESGIQSLAMVGYNADMDAIIVSWRGTLTDLNWIEDFVFFQQPWRLLKPASGLLVHTGFKTTTFVIQNKVKRAVKELKTKYRNPKTNKTPKLYFTGHSLGAAQATMSALDFYETFPKELTSDPSTGCGVVDKISIAASPLPGNGAFAHYVDRVIGDKCMVRFTNKYDLVPMVPPVWLLDYHRVGKEVFMYHDNDKPGNVQVESNKNGRLTLKSQGGGESAMLKSSPVPHDGFPADDDYCQQHGEPMGSHGLVECAAGEYGMCELSTLLVQGDTSKHSFLLYMCRIDQLFKLSK